MLLLNHTHSPTTTAILPRAHEDESFARFESARPDPGPNPPHHRSVSAKRSEDVSPSTSDITSSPRHLDTLTPRHLPETSDIRHPTSHIHPSSPLSKPTPLTDPAVSATLLIDYLAGYTAARLCASYNITLPQLFAWRSSPETRQLLKEHREFAAEQARHVQADKEPQIILTLCAIATRGTSESECRRAASDLLRAFKFRDYLAHRRPRNSESPSEEAPSHARNQIADRSNPPSSPQSSRTHTDTPSDPLPRFRNPLPEGGGRGWVRSRTQQSEDTKIETPLNRAPTNNPSAPSAPSDPSVPSDSSTNHLIPQLRLANSETQAPAAQCQAPSPPSSNSSPPLRDLRALRGSLSPTSDIESEILKAPPEISSSSPPPPDPTPGFPLCLIHKPLLPLPAFEEMRSFMPPPSKTFNPFWPESDIFFLCFPDRCHKHNLREAIVSHQEMLARSGAQALVDRHYFSPDQQSHEAYTAAVDFYQQLARKLPAPDH